MQVPYTFPWGLHPMPDWIAKEFDRRTKEYGSNPTNNINDVYSGPKTAWARFFSNGESSLATDRDGFLLGGTEGFNESYGFTDDKQIVIGVDSKGKPHKISADPIGNSSIEQGKKTKGGDFPHRPPPSLISVESQFAGGGNSSFNALCKKTTINWKCHSLTQLEYLTPYFLTPRITCLVEWGWNYYDTVSLVDLGDINWMYGIFLGKYERTGEWIKRSNGNYDLAMGFITDYTISLNEFGGYDCTTTITNANYLLEGQTYQNKNTTTVDKNTNKKIRVKDFTEFVFKDLDNLELKPKADADGRDVAKTLKIDTKGKVFKSGDEYWLRMDLVQRILNLFFSIEFLGKENKLSGAGSMKLDITGVPISAHPFLKSTDPNILFPNQFAPRFVSFDSDKKLDNVGTKGEGNLRNVKAIKSNGGSEYFKLFPTIKNVISNNVVTDAYDNLREVINPTGNSFPVFKDYTENGAKNNPAAGYWGYLQDVFISVSLFKEQVNKHESVVKLLEAILQLISRAACDITQLKPQPSVVNNAVYTVIDTNFTPVQKGKDAEQLPKITLLSNNSAFIRSAAFDIKLSGEMANQMVMQSAAGGTVPAGSGTYYVDTKTMQVSKFSTGDRMFQVGIIPPENVTPSVVSNESRKVAYERKFTYAKENKNFVVHKVDMGNYIKYYIIAETNPDFLRNVLYDKDDKNALHINNAIMPGTKLTLELLGIGGITFLSQFTLDNVPSAYNYERSVWQVSMVRQKIENKVWTTTIEAEARPLTTLDVS